MSNARKKADDCGCVPKVNEACRKQGFELDLAFNVKGQVWPVIRTKKVEGASRRAPKPPTLTPVHCPFCGKKYPEAA